MRRGVRPEQALRIAIIPFDFCSRIFISRLLAKNQSKFLIAVSDRFGCLAGGGGCEGHGVSIQGSNSIRSLDVVLLCASSAEVSDAEYGNHAAVHPSGSRGIPG